MVVRFIALLGDVKILVFLHVFLVVPQAVRLPARLIAKIFVLLEIVRFCVRGLVLLICVRFLVRAVALEPVLVKILVKHLVLKICVRLLVLQDVMVVLVNTDVLHPARGIFVRLIVKGVVLGELDVKQAVNQIA